MSAEEPTDPRLKQPPVEELAVYAGQWIATEGDEIVTFGDSPHAVSMNLKALGRRGAIWRVPASKAEAEAEMNLFGL
jgi:hypothetical protein